jgi:hypothetical protein
LNVSPRRSSNSSHVLPSFEPSTTQFDGSAPSASADVSVYLRIADSFRDDGWGGWLARLRLEQQTG